VSPVERRCENCGAYLGATSRPDRRFCSDACRVAAHARRRRDADGNHGSRGTIRKTLQTLAMVLDHAGASPNPARDPQVRLPRSEEEEVNPPTAAHVMAVYRRMPRRHRLALLWLDWSGARVSSVDLTLVGDYDEPRRRVRQRRSTTKTRRPLWVELPPALADAVEATLPHRHFRDPDARLFADSGADALRTATVGSRSSTCAASRGRGSASSSVSAASRSRPTSTRTCSPTRPRSTTPRCSRKARTEPGRAGAVRSPVRPRPAAGRREGAWLRGNGGETRALPGPS
jgi:integrase